MLLSACGSISAGLAPFDNERLADAMADFNQAPENSDAEIRTEVETRGGLENAAITLADGTRVLVDGVYAGESDAGIGYVLAGELDRAGNLTKVIQSEVGGDPYVSTNASGNFRYSGDTIAYLGDAGKNLVRLEGSSGLILDFDGGTGRVEGVARGEISGGGKAEAAFSGDIGAFSDKTGQFESGDVELSFARSGETIRDSAELSGGLIGENEGFAATLDPSGRMIEGSAVLFGTRDN